MDKLMILNKIQKHYGFEKDTDFAKFLGIPNQNLSKWKSRGTFDIELIYTKCTQINADWILTGNGEMLREKYDKGLIPDNNSDLLKKINELQEFKIQQLEKELAAFKETDKVSERNY